MARAEGRARPRGVGEYLVERANARGILLFVDTDQTVKYYPEAKMSEGFLRLLNSKYEDVRQFLLLDTIST